MKSQLLREIWWRPSETPEAPPRPLIAGSGLVRGPQGLWTVGDDLHHILRIRLDTDVAEGFRIFPGDLPEDFKARKKVKPDTEALIVLPPEKGVERWLAMPSGSKKHRVKGALLLNEPKLVVKPVDFTVLFAELERLVPDLNLEGGAILGEHIFFFQRGNGKARWNGLVQMPTAAFLKCLNTGWDIPALQIRTIPISLPEWNGVPVTFTDGLAYKGKLYFSAAAEATESTYDDGDVLGSVIGFLEAGYKPVEIGRIQDLKIEGLVAESENEFLAVTDADESAQPSLLLRLS